MRATQMVLPSVKQELAARYPADRDAYTEGNAQFVDEMARRAAGG